MATDITTLAIALQSKEAESSLKAFNDLLTTGSANAKKMENMSIGVDVSAALKELAALKAGYDDIAKSAANIHFDLGMNMPTMLAPPAPTTPPIDTAALEEMKAFFQTAAEEMRKEAERVSESMNQMGAGADRAGESVRTAGETMRGAGASAGEYAEKLREVNAAKKEMEKLAAKADADGQAAYQADQKARAAKHDLLQAERELQKVSEQLSKTHIGGAGDVMELASKEEALQNEVKNLSEAYKKAQAEADKFNAKLDASAGKADDARARYNQLQEELAGIPKPTGKAAKSVDTFAKGAKGAGTTVTKLARGFNSVAIYGGAAVPKLAGLGRTIGMFAYSGPWVGAAVVGVAALAAAFKKLRGESEKQAQYIRESAENALKTANAAKEFVSTGESDWKRLGELSNMGSLTNTQNEEAIGIIQRLSEMYGDLGIEIDKTTGKLTGYMEARIAANQKEREIQKETLTAAYEEAQDLQKEQAKKLVESAKQGFTSGDMTAFANSNKELNALLEDQNASELDIIKAFNSRKKELRDAISGEKEITYDITHRNFQGMETHVTGTVSKEAAAEQLNLIKELEEAWDNANKRKKSLERFNTAEIEDFNKAIEKASESVGKSGNAFLIEDGKARLKTVEEVYAEEKRQIDELKAKRESLNALIKDKGEMAITDSGKYAGEESANITEKINRLTYSTLQYEQRISEEKAKQTKALNDAINADQMRINQFKESYITDKNGDIVRKKNADELAQDREEEIKSLQALIKEKGYGNTLEEEKELVAARLKLAQLQAEDMKYRDQVAAAGKKNEDARKGYVFSEYTGSVLRKKTEDELQRERENEIEAARARVKATEEGTLERAQAQAELDRLAIEEYNARKKTGANAAVQEANTENSRLVRGIEARSTEAMALEARSFRRDDSEKAILKDTKNVQTDIKGLVQNVLAIMTNMGANFSEISENIQPL